MPKVKSSPNKKSTRTISTKRFSLTKLQIAFGVLILAIVGAVVVYKSEAATAPAVSLWNTGNSGRGWHDTGNVINGVQTAYNGQISAWMELGGSPCYASCPNGHFMWYGPYGDVPTGSHTLHACWVYLAGTTKGWYVIFDVNAQYPSGTQHLIYNGTDAQTYIPPNGLAGGYLPQSKCVDIALTPGVHYQKLEVRVKPVSGGNGLTSNAFMIWKTSWSVTN